MTSSYRAIGRAARLLLLVATALLVGSCQFSSRANDTAETDSRTDYARIAASSDHEVSFRDEVQPVLEHRCVVCHGCYDAPCQLKLSSYEGITRGASKVKVYDGERINAAEPTRLFIDAKTPAEWRAKGFSPVLDEPDNGADRDLAGSVLYRMLRMKQAHPQPQTGRLPADYDLDLDRKQVCTDPAGFQDFARDHPLWGMPYAMPNLDAAEYQVLVTWVAQGAKPSPPATPSAQARPQVDAWERFLNAPGNKTRLMSRYLYEHLFLAHLHLEGTGPREFYRLVRSRTPPGQPEDEIPSVRPFDDPGAAPFYYRLRLYDSSIAAKDHLAYPLSPARMARYRQLFLEPDYAVTELPSYDQALASNPFKTFNAIPSDARYRFMLDDARFFINGFMKGPVCRGQVALNVINDHFWVVFTDPDRGLFVQDPALLDEVSDYLQMPAQYGSSTKRLLRPWLEYSKKQQVFLDTLAEKYRQIPPEPLDSAVKHVWDGDGTNPNAALTVFRHFDSASVQYGLVGDYPETAWLLNYPLFERIHYLLVAGFDVYGNLGHQLTTRLYMDFLRMEGETYFLSFMPADRRQAIRDRWYEGPRSPRSGMPKEPAEWFKADVVVGYRTDDPQREFYRALEGRLGPVAGPPDTLNRCAPAGCATAGTNEARRKVEAALHRMTALRGAPVSALPDVTFLRVTGGDPRGGDEAYSLVLNKGYRNLKSIFASEDQRDPGRDTVTILPGFAGVYPNFYLEVRAADLDAFADSYAGARNPADLENLFARYGRHRTDPQFWAAADWFQAAYDRAEGLEAGILDLSRYENR